MECSQDLACQLLDWFSRSGYALRQAFGFIDTVWDGAGDQISTFFSEHGEKLTAMAGFGFATYKWWVYRERILYRRLEEYIRDSDKRLRPTTAQMMDAVLRPGRAVALRQPAFAVEISKILDRNGWRQPFGLTSIEHQARDQFEKALTGIRKRQETVQDAAQSLQRQKAEVHKLMGTVAAAAARRAPDSVRAAELDEQALNEFRNALQCSTHHRDAKAKECEALQYLRLGELDLALAALIDLERFARELKIARDRDLTRARAKRYQAHILQLQVFPSGSRNAWGVLARDGDEPANGEPSALELRRAYGPYSDWDAIEQAEMHYLAAFVANQNGFGLKEPEHLRQADSLYRGLLRKLPKRHIFLRSWTRKLRAEAQLGKDRVILAKTGRYDLEWLMLDKLNQAKENAETVGQSSGTDGIENAPS